MMEPIVERAPPRRNADRRREEELEMLARWMDSVFRIPGVGIRFGLDALIGLIPGFGDTLTSLVSIYILAAGARLGVPRVTLVRMALNIAIDWLLGSFPVLGDVFDVYWKANQRNVALLRRHAMAAPAQERRARAGDWLFVGGLICSLLLLVAASLAAAFFLVSWWARTFLAPPR